MRIIVDKANSLIYNIIKYNVIYRRKGVGAWQNRNKRQLILSK